MKTHASSIALVLLSLAAANLQAAPAAALPSDVIPARGGAIRITPIFHASLQIEYHGTVIQVDPFSKGDYSGTKKADLILITHDHPDHFDQAAINTVSGTFVRIVAPVSVTSRLKATPGRKVIPLKNGATLSLQSSFTMRIEAVPMYNLRRGPKPGQFFHPKGHGNGYVLAMGGRRIYIAGDTEVTPEMRRLKNIDVAFLPMNLPFTMTPGEAAVGARAFKPGIVYPYHYRYPFDKANSNPQQFKAALSGQPIEVRLRSWYAAPATKP